MSVISDHQCLLGVALAGAFTTYKVVPHFFGFEYKNFSKPIDITMVTVFSGLSCIWGSAVISSVKKNEVTELTINQSLSAGLSAGIVLRILNNTYRDRPRR